MLLLLICVEEGVAVQSVVAEVVNAMIFTAVVSARVSVSNVVAILVFALVITSLFMSSRSSICSTSACLKTSSSHTR